MISEIVINEYVDPQKDEYVGDAKKYNARFKICKGEIIDGLYKYNCSISLKNILRISEKLQSLF